MTSCVQLWFKIIYEYCLDEAKMGGGKIGPTNVGEDNYSFFNNIKYLSTQMF